MNYSPQQCLSHVETVLLESKGDTSYPYEHLTDDYLNHLLNVGILANQDLWLCLDQLLKEQKRRGKFTLDMDSEAE